MTRLVVLGHGSFHRRSFETLVPPNTTLRFFSDAGSKLNLPANQVGDDLVFDYAKVANVLSHYKETESPLQAGGVVYNMMLEKVDAASQKIAEDLDKAGKWGGEMLLNPTDLDWKLCEGDEKTCPTPKLYVAKSRHDELVAMGDAAVRAFKDMLAAGSSELPEELAGFQSRLADVPQHYRQYVADGVPDSAWEHRCDGILKKGTGKDIFWVACSGFMAPKTAKDALAMPSQMTADTDGPGLDWKPDAEVLKRIRDLNQQKVKDTPDGQSIAIVAGGDVVLIGEGHEADPANFAKAQGDFSQGTLTVTKGGAFSKGGIKIQGIPTPKQGVVKKRIESFSDKKVTFA
jgi:hypothetical protein